jgi:hypothetical protein
VRFAIGLPNVGAYGDPGLLVELGSMAEQSDWDGVFIESHTDVDSSSEARRMADYEDVGLTWWVEKLGWFRGSVDDMRRRIGAGPPRR